VTADNATSNDTQQEHLTKKDNSFQEENHIRCFNHTLQLSTKALLCPFNPALGKAANINRNGGQGVLLDMEDLDNDNLDDDNDEEGDPDVLDIDDIDNDNIDELDDLDTVSCEWLMADMTVKFHIVRSKCEA